jgi:hypothetical protein
VVVALRPKAATSLMKCATWSSQEGLPASRVETRVRKAAWLP